MGNISIAVSTKDYCIVLFPILRRHHDESGKSFIISPENWEIISRMAWLVCSRVARVRIWILIKTDKCGAENVKCWTNMCVKEGIGGGTRIWRKCRLIVLLRIRWRLCNLLYFWIPWNVLKITFHIFQCPLSSQC